MLCSALAFTMTLAIAPPTFADQEVAQIYVSLKGSDSAEGTIDKPLKSIQAAKKMVNKLKQEGGFSGAVVNIREGIYNIGRGITFNKIDSGSEDTQIIYKAYNNEDVRITSGFVLDSQKFMPVTDQKIIDRLIPQAASKIRVYDLAADGITEYGQLMKPMITRTKEPSSALLIENGDMCTMAEWPNRAYAGVEKITQDPGVKYSWTMNTDRVSRWTQAKDAQVYGMPVYDWYDDTLNVAYFEPTTKTIATNDSHPYGFSKNALIRVQNLMEEIDIPGEWYLDRVNKKLYVYPTGDVTKNDYTICTYDTPLITLEGADYIKFDGLKFEGTRTHAVHVKSGNHNTFYDCEFRALGGQAILQEKGSRYNTYERLHIHDVGKGGITLNGKDTNGDLTPDRNVIKNCLFERCGVIGGIGINAISANGVADEIIHNRIHAGEHSAIMFMGNDNLIAYNDFYDMLRHAKDAGVVYTGRTWNCIGNRIEYNYFHDCTKLGKDIAAGIYFDDQDAGNYIKGNIFQNLNRTMYLHGTNHQTVENNMSINNYFNEYSTGNVLSVTNEQLIKWSDDAKKMYEDGTLKEAYKAGHFGGDNKDILNRLYGALGELDSEVAEIYYKKYPWLRTQFSGGKAFWPKNNVIRNNIVYFADEGQNGSLEKKGSTWNYTQLAAHPDANNVSENNHSFDGWPQTVTNSKHDPRITDWSQIKAVNPDFEELNPDEMGIEGEDEIFLEDFRLMSPVNGAEDVDAHDVVLLWSEKAGGNRYRLVVATDKDFKDIVFDDIVKRNYKVFTNLRYGCRTYYWKVQAISDHYKCKDNTRWNSDGVYTFRTAEAETVNKFVLDQTIQKARKEYDSSVEGDKPGQFVVGAKSKFLPFIEKAEAVFNSRTATRNQVDRNATKLENEYLNFIVFKNPEELNIGTLISDVGGWFGGKPSGGAVKLSNGQSFGYTGDKLKPNNIVKMKAKFNFPDGEAWVSIGLRASAVTGTCWNNIQYAMLVKSDAIELQSWGVGSSSIFQQYKNDFIKDGVEHDVEFSALNEADGIRIKLIVDGKEVFSYLDEASAISTTSYLQLYSANGGGVTLSPA